MRLRHQLVHLHRHLAALLAQQLPVEQHALLLHALQHRHQRLFQLCVQAHQPRIGLELRPQRLLQPQRHIHVLRRIRRRPVDGHLTEGDLLGALTRDFLIGDRAHPEL